MNKLLVFGGSGYLGNAIVEYAYNTWDIVSFARGEAKQSALKKKYPNIQIKIGNIQNEEDVKRTIFTTEPTFIIVASALKDISICQQFPDECIRTNIIGVQNVLSGLFSYGISCMPHSVCFVSTDKAVEPINIYGTSKYLGEQLVNEQNHEYSPNYFSVRYGNVLNSTGSLLPVLKEQLKTGVVKVTNSNMTRFSLSVEEAVKTIFYGYEHNIKGVLIPTKLKSFRIGDVVDVLAEKYKFKTETIGAASFEKKHEILISKQEKADIVGDYLLVRKSGIYSDIDYSSENSIMSIDELKGLINDYI